MNCQRAFKILEIENLSANTETIRKQYKMLALKWHPDRNKAPNAADKYREIKDAHDFLLEKNKKTDDDSYRNIASTFFETLYNNEHFQRHIFHPLLMKVTTLCEEKALAFVLRLDADRATKLLETIEIWKTTLHFSDAFFEKIREHISKRSIYRCIVLNPNIDDLMQSNVCRVEGIIVPLWHSLLTYEKEGLIVHCLPELPENMWIDDDDDENTLNVMIEDNIIDIWKRGFLEFSIGTKTKRIEKNILKMCETQVVLCEGEGIPVPHMDNVFYDGTRGCVRVHIKMH